MNRSVNRPSETDLAPEASAATAATQAPAAKPRRFWRYWAVAMLLIVLISLGASYVAAQWLAAQAPRVTAGPLGGFMLDDGPGDPRLPPLERIDASGQGEALPEPPQPLTDGSRGVPQRPAVDASAPIPVVQATASGSPDPNNPVPAELPQDQPFIDFDTLTLPERLAIQQAEAVELPRTETLPSPGAAPIVVVEAVQPAARPAQPPMPTSPTPTVSAVPAPTASAPPPPTAPAPPPAPASAITPNPDAWVRGLQQDIQTCSSLGFFARTACESRARQRWCEPNNGYNRIRECGFRSNDVGGGN